MNRLYEQGFISNSVGKAERLFSKLFVKREP